MKLRLTLLPAKTVRDLIVLARAVQHRRNDIHHSRGVRDAVENAFAAYEATRKPRATGIQTGSSRNTWLRGKTDPGWVYGYDACSDPLIRAGAQAAP